MIQIDNGMQIITVKYFKQFLLTLYFVFSFSCFSFSKEQKDSTLFGEKKIHFKVFISPFYSLEHTQSGMTQLSLSNTPSEDIQHLTYASKDEKGMLGYEIGVLTEMSVSKNVFIDFGLSYGKINYQTIPNTIIYVSQTSQFMPVSNYSTNYIQVKHIYTYFSVPIIFNYQFKKEKFVYSLGAGVSSYLLSASTEETPGEQYGEQQTIYKEVGKINLSLILNAGFSKHINKVLDFGIEPNFKYYLANVSNQFKLFTLGANVFLKF